MIKEIHHGEAFVAPGENALHFSNFAKVILQKGPVVETVGNVLALDCCDFRGREAPKTVCALASFILPPRSSS